MIQIQPLLSQILIELEPEPAPSSIIAVQRFTEGLARFAKVLAIGPEVRDVQVGQRVMASITAGVEMPGRGILISEAAVLATAAS